MSCRVEVVNRSDWPTPALRVLARWIVARADPNVARYTVTVRGCRSQTWGGRGAIDYQRVWLDRRYRSNREWPDQRRRREAHTVPAHEDARSARHILRRNLREWQAKGIRYTSEQLRDRATWAWAEMCDASQSERALWFSLRRVLRIGRIATPQGRPRLWWPFVREDHRFGWSEREEYRSRFELLVGLIAHEACHATPAGRQRPGQPNARACMERRCNRFAIETVEALRAEWPKLRGQIFRAMRSDRDAAKRAKARKAESKGPEMKLARAQANLANWEKRAKRAANAMKKYRRQVRYYEGRAAANTPNPGADR